MKTTIMLAATVTWFAACLPAAQAEEKPTFVITTYFHCNSARVGQADDAVANVYKADLDGLVKGGGVSSWAWLGKYMGGDSVRAGYITGSNVQVLMNATDKAAVVRSDGHPPKMEARALEEACGSGEDYVWRVQAGSDPRAKRGQFAVSTYFVCDPGREAEADAVLRPKFEQQFKTNKLSTWTWAEHVVGGKYQRLATMTGDNLNTLIAAHEELEHAIADKAAASICGSHQDFIWETLNQG
jgi:hypothetical protein